ncbi:hypothetical protein [Paenibacillus pinihumi]|uniref:hypothetical protein n=1 Tax=Paenibacillus pinihumi TaxID=669462 RepID=UPI000416E653|nr:hypothetical protein [Paenibacillus pinihumi]
MKKKLMMLGTVLVISAVSAQAAFAATPNENLQGQATLSVSETQFDMSKFDWSKVKQGKAVEAGKVSEAAKGTLTSPGGGKSISAPSLAATDAEIDLSNVREGKAKAIGKVSGTSKGATTTKK